MNEKQYDHPERFNPERYLGPSPALESPVFGFGRRACLGVHYSTAAIFVTVSSILSVFDLRAQDKDGKDVQIDPAFTGGMSSLCTGTVLSLYPALLHCTALLDARLLKKQIFLGHHLFRFIGMLTFSPLRSGSASWLIGFVRYSRVAFCLIIIADSRSLLCVPFTYKLISIAIRNLSPAGSPYAPRNLPSLSRQGHPCCKRLL
jgi:hypothetical protein